MNHKETTFTSLSKNRTQGGSFRQELSELFLKALCATATDFDENADVAIYASLELV